MLHRRGILVLMEFSCLSVCLFVRVFCFVSFGLFVVFRLIFGAGCFLLVSYKELNCMRLELSYVSGYDPAH